ncbi:MAG: hypothetical protein SPI12_03205 [Actinomycetaceae bacterium]|nr:hypothetical protein [Actinomycetaceae bacterium]MDY6082853.1 hypothetical protein [Actinomycetaceae bacterium]
MRRNQKNGQDRIVQRSVIVTDVDGLPVFHAVTGDGVKCLQ